MGSLHPYCARLSWIIVLGLLAGCAFGSTAEPIIIDAPVLFCELSPSRRYVDTVLDTDTSQFEFRIYDLETGQPVVEDLLPPTRDAAHWIWLPDDIRFHYTDSAQRHPGTLHPIPLNGWLVDIPNHVITDVLSLSPVDQAAIFAQVEDAFLQRRIEMGGEGSISPDGQYIATEYTIWEYLGPGRGRGRLLNKADTGHAGNCNFRWKHDSSGIYFPELSGPRQNLTGGPIRFLPVIPPK